MIVAFLGLIGYFGYHAAYGTHGLLARSATAAQARLLTARLDSLRNERGHLEQRVTLMRSGSLDPDLLDEQARSMLGYAHPHDMVIFDHEPAP